ncbi:MAG: hypothetical protein HQK67_09050, partial [Desulfamplus sp.]|nr:hypothetical protein [Desulfamplus sp.]
MPDNTVTDNSDPVSDTTILPTSENTMLMNIPTSDTRSDIDTPDIDLTDFKESLCSIAKYAFGRNMEDAGKIDIFNALCFIVRRYMIDIQIASEKRYLKNDVKRMHYI